MKVKTALYVFHEQHAWQDEPTIAAYTFKPPETDALTFINEQSVDLYIPDNYDPRAQQIAALEAHKQKIMADYQKSLNKINARISKLLALEYTA
jgi:pantothenate kinase